MRQPGKGRRPPDAVSPGSRPGRRQTLVCGFGNPGRGDDGLGPALVARLEAESRLRRRTDIRTETRLQLNIEDALTVSGFDLVIFVDASRRGREPYEFRKIRSSTRFSFSTHSLSPGSVLALCRELYGKSPQAYILAIRGRSFGLGEGLSEQASRGLDGAAAFLLERLKTSGPD